MPCMDEISGPMALESLVERTEQAMGRCGEFVQLTQTYQARIGAEDGLEITRVLELITDRLNKSSNLLLHFYQTQDHRLVDCQRLLNKHLVNAERTLDELKVILESYQ